MDQRKRRRILNKKLGETLSELGFAYHSGNCFIRDRNDIRDVFLYQQTRSNGRFYISCGIDLPNIRQDILGNEILHPSKSPSMIITASIGRLFDGRTFGCKYEEHIDNACPKVLDVVQSEALPFFEKYVTARDVIKKYHSSHIGIIDFQEAFEPGKIVRSTMYGIMLYDAGCKDDSLPWLKHAKHSWQNKSKLGDEEREWLSVLSSRVP